MSEEQSLRYRINITKGMKGTKSFDVTVDGTGYTEEEILEKSKSIVAKLDAEYPAPTE
jgi:hypothetical protein